MTTNTKVATISFHGQQLITAKIDNEIFVAMKPVVSGIGVSWQGQHEKLKNNPARWGIKEIFIASEGGEQSTICLPLRKLHGWLMTIHPGKIKNETIRDNVITYQNECDDALWKYWSEGIAINQRMQYSVGPNDKLTKEQADTLRQMLTEAAEKAHPNDTKKQGVMIRAGWSKLKAHFKVSYREIPAIEFTEAVSMVARHAIEGDFIGKSDSSSSKEDENVNQIVKRFADQIRAGNGYPTAVFMPIVDAVFESSPALLDKIAARELTKPGARFVTTFANLNGWTVPVMHALPPDAQPMTDSQFIDRVKHGFPDSLIPNLLGAVANRMQPAKPASRRAVSLA